MFLRSTVLVWALVRFRCFVTDFMTPFFCYLVCLRLLCLFTCFAVSFGYLVCFLAFSLLLYLVYINRHLYLLFISPLDPPCTPQLSWPTWFLATLQNMSFSSILDSFCIVFSSLPWIYTLLHPSLSIITHLHSFLIILHKSHKMSCPGKFPRP